MQTHHAETLAKSRFGILLLLLLFLCMLIIVAPALAQPSQPYWAWGTVTSNGRLAPNGVTVTAWCGGRSGGSQCDANSWDATENGNYLIPVACAGRTDGERIDFKITGTNGNTYWANEYGTFICTEVEQVNLTVNALPPTAVTLSSLSVTRGYNRLFVRWQTADETGLLGFNLYRGTQPQAMEQGTAVKLNGRLIAGRSSAPGQGAAYGFIDRGLEPATSYYYWIESVMTSGGRQVDGPVASVAPGADTCTDKGICPVVPGPGGQ